MIPSFRDTYVFYLRRFPPSINTFFFFPPRLFKILPWGNNISWLWSQVANESNSFSLNVILLLWPSFSVNFNFPPWLCFSRGVYYQEYAWLLEGFVRCGNYRKQESNSLRECGTTTFSLMKRKTKWCETFEETYLVKK